MCNWRGFALGVLQVVLFTILCLIWSSKEHCVAKILLVNLLVANIFLLTVALIPSNIVTNLLFMPFLPFRRNQKQKSRAEKLASKKY